MTHTDIPVSIMLYSSSILCLHALVVEVDKSVLFFDLVSQWFIAYVESLRCVRWNTWRVLTRSAGTVCTVCWWAPCWWSVWAKTACKQRAIGVQVSWVVVVIRLWLQQKLLRCSRRVSAIVNGCGRGMVSVVGCATFLWWAVFSLKNVLIC